jgi:excisionase family DNA binding protein
MQFLSKKQVCQKTSLSRATIDRNREEGKFPEPMVWGSRLMFDADEVEAWMLARKAERDRLLNTSR